MTGKIADLQDNDVIEISKKEFQTTIETEKTKAIEQTKNDIAKQQIISVREKAQDDPNRLGKFFAQSGNIALKSLVPQTIEWRNGQIVKENNFYQMLTKGMGLDFASGGAWIPESLEAEILPLLKAEAVVRGAGVRVRPMPNGNLTIRKNTSGVTGSWGGSVSNIAPSGMEIGTIQMSAKKLGILVPIANDLLALTSGTAYSEVQKDIISGAATYEDEAFLLGSGSDYSPKGLKNWCDSGNIVTMTASPDAAKIYKDLMAMQKKVYGGTFIKKVKPTYIMNSTNELSLKALLNSNNLPLFPELMNGKLHGATVLVSELMPDASIIFVDLAYSNIAQTLNMKLEFLPNTAYQNAAGTVVAGASTDESIFRLVHEVDFAQSYVKSISVINSLTWSAL